LFRGEEVVILKRYYGRKLIQEGRDKQINEYRLIKTSVLLPRPKVVFHRVLYWLTSLLRANA